MPTPLISVLIVCRNPGPDLHAAVESVWAQRDADAEIVIVDGASTDGTVRWLETHATRLGAWLSEPDRGVYDAMNKGVALARGEWVLHLGADDRLAPPGALASLAPALLAAHAGVVAGTARYDDGRAYAPKSSRHAIRRNFLHHQSTFYRRAVLSRLGGYDASLRFQGDFDLNLRLLHAGAGILHTDTLVAVCRGGGLSDAGHWANYREEIAVRHRHFPAWRCLPWDAVATIRYLRKKLLRREARARPE